MLNGINGISEEKFNVVTGRRGRRPIQYKIKV